MTTSSWCRAARARLVFPTPPGPRIEILGESCLSRPTTSSSSDSLPWNIFGTGGKRVMDSELYVHQNYLEVYNETVQYLFVGPESATNTWQMGYM
jgi:hypothetical protein